MTTGTTPRSNARMLNDLTTTYETALYSHDQGMWTIYEIVKRPIAKVACQSEAHRLIKVLEHANRIDKGGDAL